MIRPEDYRVPIPEEIKMFANDLAKEITDKFPGWGFAIMLFKFQGEEFMWISNADRQDMLKALQEFIQKQGS